MIDNMRERYWHILWAPFGFGRRAEKLVEIWSVVKRDDPESDAFYPTYRDVVGGHEVLIPLFPNYMFIKCRWHLGIEDRIRDNSGAYVSFLQRVGKTTSPYQMTEKDLERVKKLLEDRVDIAKELWHVDDLKVGDRVVLRAMQGVIGTILYFLPPNKAMVETKLFNQSTPVPVKVADLERV